VGKATRQPRVNQEKVPKRYASIQSISAENEYQAGVAAPCSLAVHYRPIDVSFTNAACGYNPIKAPPDFNPNLLSNGFFLNAD
jgi:hypothetical protein